jgi:hypothetical protein
MTYNPNIPISDDSPANQAPAIQTDFSQFASVFANNHTVVNSQNQGDHETIVMQNQTSNPTITNNMAVLYSKNASSKAGTQPQLFLRIPIYLPNKYVTRSPGNPPMQLTYNQVNTTGPQYQSFLAGGYLLFFGQTSISNPATTIQITLSPAPTKIILAMAYANSTTAGVSRGVATEIDSNSQFTISTVAFTSPNVPFTWIAIATV